MILKIYLIHRPLCHQPIQCSSCVQSHVILVPNISLKVKPYTFIPKKNIFSRSDCFIENPSSTDVGSHVSRQMVSLLEVLPTHLLKYISMLFKLHSCNGKKYLTTQSICASLPLKTTPLPFAVVAPHVKNCNLSFNPPSKGCVCTLPRSEVMQKVSLR